MNTNYDVFYFEDFIGRYAASIGKPVVYFRSYGWNNSSNVDAINASMELYKEVLPLDLWTSLKQSEYVFMEVEDIEDTMNFLDHNFPESQAATTTAENYIHFSLYNAEGQIIHSNE